MKISRILITAAFVASCSSAPLSLKMAESEIRRNPTAAELDGRGGELKWNYTTGLELKAFLDVAVAGSGQTEAITSYVEAWYDAIIAEDGSIGGKYKRSNYNVDHICPARTLFALYDITGKEKYRAAMDSIYMQICGQPRSFVELDGYEAGAFWHKKVYPNQQWLDGLYMALPFYAEYNLRYIRSQTEKDVNFDDIANQFRIAYDHCYDPQTKLLRHAWDSSRKMFWCDPVTGQSAHAWGRAMGWYMMALVDVLDFVPEEHPGRQHLLGILDKLLTVLPEYADKATGMWYQVLDCPGREGNYVESTCSAM
ncbi:MAG: glycoside hydrolase family 88 protein, partial [Bacteroidales bacterium]|nr:glycoside hydrolase family 88 protein [Bacteroidales bacterium]